MKRLEAETATFTLKGGLVIEVSHGERKLLDMCYLLREGKRTPVSRVVRLAAYVNDWDTDTTRQWVEYQIAKLASHGICVISREDDCRWLVIASATGLKGVLIAEYGTRCVYCGVNVLHENFTADHVVPKAHGGSDSLSNLRPCCHSCNQVKRDRTPDQWATDILTGVEPKEGNYLNGPPQSEFPQGFKPCCM